MNKKIVFSLFGVVIVGLSILLLKGSNIVPSIKVNNQLISNDSVVVESVTAVSPSWLVIQTETNGIQGPVIGYTKINKGENKNISVKIDSGQKTPKLFAMIHEDNGEKNKFDFPDNDMPLFYNGEMVLQLFSIE